ncbi:hypothetical protein GCM10010401_05930 [Rarobacter faecitabidus]|uniref:Uncharacterized protein n=1 Tax=Rarobacter faecitabidus TaxID=13243 RepID=A0A542ZTG7_RARFA|nr:hypothetical protein [Rarobacter faecitabidus]TQL63655.1 hypothetical protein FB461_0122 [Rarobacter faecitabidus]
MAPFPSELLATLTPLAVQHDSLAIPAHRNIVALAAARFEKPHWVVTPEQAAAASAPTRGSGGARFRGAAIAVETVDPQFALTEGLIINGPFRIGARDAQGAGLLPVEHDIYVLPDADEATVAALREWAMAVARHCWGAVIQSSGNVLRPDPESLVDLRLYSPDPQPNEVVATALRPVLPQIQPFQDRDGSEALYMQLEYDGTIVIRRYRASRELPPALSTVDWREFGPHVYEVSWIPPAPEELDNPSPSALHLIARRRASQLVARAATVLREQYDGTVLDFEDFMVRPADLKARTQGKYTGLA